MWRSWRARERGKILTLRDVLCAFGMVKIPALRELFWSFIMIKISTLLDTFRRVTVNFAEIVEILTLREDCRRCYTLSTAESSKSLPYSSFKESKPRKVRIWSKTQKSGIAEIIDLIYPELPMCDFASRQFRIHSVYDFGNPGSHPGNSR